MLSVLFAACMMGLVSCGMSPSQQADINVSSGEIIASADTGIVDLESGKVAGYLENGIYIYKGIPYAKAERFMAPLLLINGRVSVVAVPMARLVPKGNVPDGEMMK